MELNHTIVQSRDKRAGAAFLTRLLDMPDPVEFGPFLVVQTGNGVSLDYMDAPDTTGGQHYAFLLTGEEFDAAFARLQAEGVPFGPSPWQRDTMETNTNDGGRGVYFDDPSGHVMELLTVPYGGWS